MNHYSFPRRALAMVAATLLSTAAVAQSTPGDVPEKPEAFSFAGSFASSWLASDAMKINLDESNSLPVLVPPAMPIDPALYVWDHWPVRTPDGAVANIDGYTVLVALTAEKSEIEVPGQRHGVATWRYFYTQGGDWVSAGEVFPPGTALGGRQWAGSTVYDPSNRRITFYYTALGDLPASAAPPAADSPAIDCYEEVYLSGGGPRGREEDCGGGAGAIENPEQLQQQALAATTATVISGAGAGVQFESFTPHQIVATAGGTYYLTAAQAAASGLPYIFRDPWYFQDPADGREYLLFSASSVVAAGPHSGVIGLAGRAQDGRWQLLPPLAGALQVNAQVERPHIVIRDGRYYLFFSSHSFSFADDLTGPEGLYGVVSEASTVRGRYVPLNGSGLVLGNPANAPLQTYSYLVLPDAQVMSFVNYTNLGDVTLAGIKNQTAQWQRDRFGGTPAPLIPLQIDGMNTTYGQRPAGGAR